MPFFDPITGISAPENMEEFQKMIAELKKEDGPKKTPIKRIDLANFKKMDSDRLLELTTVLANQKKVEAVNFGILAVTPSALNSFTEMMKLNSSIKSVYVESIKPSIKEYKIKINKLKTELTRLTKERSVKSILENDAPTKQQTATQPQSDIEMTENVASPAKQDPVATQRENASTNATDTPNIPKESYENLSDRLKNMASEFQENPHFASAIAAEVKEYTESLSVDPKPRSKTMSRDNEENLEDWGLNSGYTSQKTIAPVNLDSALTNVDPAFLDENTIEPGIKKEPDVKKVLDVKKPEKQSAIQINYFNEMVESLEAQNKRISNKIKPNPSLWERYKNLGYNEDKKLIENMKPDLYSIFTQVQNKKIDLESGLNKIINCLANANKKANSIGLKNFLKAYQETMEHERTLQRQPHPEVPKPQSPTNP